MAEERGQRRREQPVGRRGTEEEEEEGGEAAAPESRESWTWTRPVGWDEQSLLRAELGGRGSREAVGPDGGRGAAGPREGGEATGPGEAAEPGPRDSDGPGGEEGAGARPARPGGGEMAAPEGGAAAGLEVAGGREGPGRLRQSRSGEDRGRLESEAAELGDQEDLTFREKYWEGAEGRYRERVEKHKHDSLPEDEWRHPLEKKAKRQEIAGPVESPGGSLTLWDSPTPRRKDLTGDSAEQLFRRPKLKFSIHSSKAGRPPSDTSFSIINELAKMGDPEVLEMVKEEGRNGPRGRGRRVGLPPGDVGGPAAWSPGTFTQGRVPCARLGLQDPALGGWAAPHGFLRCSCKPRPSSHSPLCFQEHLPFCTSVCARGARGKCWEAR